MNLETRDRVDPSKLEFPATKERRRVELASVTNMDVFYARKLDLSEITQEFLDQWSALECSSLEDNAFLSSSFVIPAIENLSKGQKILMVPVYRNDSSTLCGLGIFTYHLGSLSYPLPHLQAFKSQHSFLTGLLLDVNDSLAIAAEMMSFVKSSYPSVCCIRFRDVDLTGRFGEVIHELGKTTEFSWHESSTVERACLSISELDNDWEKNLSKRRMKTYRNALNRLKAIDSVEWRLIQSNEAGPTQIQDFLQLEHKGWKGDNGDSLLSQENQERFFVQTVENFARSNGVFFTELLLGDEIIASTCNFISGNSGFAFKIGWDPDYQKYSPGIVNEIEFLRHTDTSALPINSIDSGAPESSFINHYWSGRKTLSRGILAFGSKGSAIACIMQQLRLVKRRLTSS
jgi:GNAT acetyltransferase-like protein